MGQLKRFQIWFYAAAVYNVIWGTVVVLFPNFYFDLVGLDRPLYPSIWQSVGMMVAVYGPGYWLIAKYPKRYAAYVWIGILGKTFGPLGFLFAVTTGKLPWAFGWTLLTNDLVWWIPMWTFAFKYAKPADILSD